MKINLLNDDTIQKIAAGEVVERPQSIIKELVENSIDADADEIIVEIKKGGKEYIKVSDNGSGIEKDQIELAFKRHATSKISEFEDLYKIYTMGFRGEALASIVAVSSLDIYSKTSADSSGIHLYYDNNKLISKKSIGMNQGTIIEVKNLFRYLPVRKKFLLSDIAEGNKITALMYSFAIANQNKSISYIKDDKLIFKTFKENSLKDNLRILFGNDYADNILEIHSNKGEYKISGYISNNSFYKGNRSMQYIFVNGRYIEDPELINHLETKYNTFIPSGRFPAFQIFIDTNPQNIDINISPNKQKIKFSFADELYEELKNTIYDAIYQSQRVKELKIENKQAFKPNFYDLNAEDSYDKILKAYSNTLQKNNLDTLLPQKDEFSINESKDELTQDEVNIDIIDLDDSNLDDTDFFMENAKDNQGDFIIKDEALDDDFNPKFDIEVEYIGSLFNRYMIFKEFSKQDLLIVDYLAARQRILFDELLESINNKSILSTQLLSPILIEFGPKDHEKYNLNKQLFEEFGFEIDEFGEHTIAIRSVPYIGEKPANKDMFLNIFDNLSKTSTRDEYISILKRKALGYAINKKSNLSKDEALQVYKRLVDSSNKFATQSGKKIMFTLSEEEFERILNKWNQKLSL